MNGDFSFLKGNIETIILCSLNGKDGQKGDKYGYEIAKEIKDRTDGKYEIKQPTLYSYLKKLEQQGQIESYWGTESNGGRRRYYKLTRRGKQDCEQFMAEWEYHKTVLSTLVDTPENPIDISQEDVTPLFGEKKRAKKNARRSELDEQDEISRRLDALIGTTDEEQAEPTSPPQPQETPLYAQQQSIFDAAPQPEPQPQPTTIQDEQKSLEETQADVLAKFEVKQDDAESFMQQFDERARIITDGYEDVEVDENYQHVLLKVLGDQLDDMQEYSSEQEEGAQKYYTDHPVALEDVADNLAQRGIRMRIYNHATANYKSKTLMPNPSVLCKTSWITYAIACVYFGFLLFTSITNNNWRPFLITLCVMLLAPIAFTMYALYDASRKPKPRFVFGKMLLIASALALIISLAALGISIISRIELSDFVEVSTKILIPVGVAITLPTFVIIYNFYYKKY